MEKSGGTDVRDIQNSSSELTLHVYDSYNNILEPFRRQRRNRLTLELFGKDW